MFVALVPLQVLMPMEWAWVLCVQHILRFAAHFFAAAAAAKICRMLTACQQHTHHTRQTRTHKPDKPSFLLSL